MRYYLYRLPLMCAALPLGGCEGAQSSFIAHGAEARHIAELTWVLVIGGALIFIATMLLGVWAMWGFPAHRAALAKSRFIVAAGIAFPVLALSALLVYTIVMARNLDRHEDAPALRIAVTGEMWWWRVVYLDDAGRPYFETANEIRIPVGRPVELILTTADVIHSFWVPSLAGKLDMLPGHVNRLRIKTDVPGTYRGQCAEYCGAQHAKMAFYTVALPPAEFDAWMAAQAAPAATSAEPLALRGRDVFLRADCARCHAVRGTPSDGASGPDLTHVGSRLSLAAGILPNTTGAFGGWIAASQHIKPGNKMPSFGELEPQDLRALAAYMESLR